MSIAHHHTYSDEVSEHSEMLNIPLGLTKNYFIRKSLFVYLSIFPSRLNALFCVYTTRDYCIAQFDLAIFLAIPLLMCAGTWIEYNHSRRH